MSSTVLLLSVIAAPLIASIISLLSYFAGSSVRKGAICLHVISTIIVLVGTSTLAWSVFTQGPLLALDSWFYLDGLSGLFIAVLGVVGFITGLYSLGYIGHEYKEGEIDGKKVSLYYGLFNLFLATMLISVASNNVIMMWVAIEATTVSSVFLVGLYGKRSSLEAAWKYIVICSVGVAFGLFGSILAYSNAAAVLSPIDHPVLWTTIKENATLLDPTLVHLSFVFIIIGFGTKTGLFPMHAWLPDAHSEAPSPVSALLSAGLLNCALLVILRYYIITVKAIGPHFPQMLLMTFGFLSVAVAAFFIITQRDIKRLLAYSSVENMGLITLAIGLGPIGVIAGLLHVINHSLGKTLMFCGAGNILLKFGSRNIDEVKGIMRVAPVTAVLVGVGALALGGVPPFNLFISEFMVVTAGISSGNTMFTIILLLMLTIVLAGLARMVASCVLGPKPDLIERGELGFMTTAPLVLLLIAMVIMGTAIPQPVLTGLDHAALVVLDSQDTTIIDALHLPWESSPSSHTTTASVALK
ncbi:NADH dehydrogenase subunit N [Photobacterium sp. SKA34]|uniref:hydrogenase 4 subunit F n=1 Tax=Photobacterium sp. SKA34 TaxID=121723 RepID=UPI00006AF7D0|nr:hydrogenase 4 subunit F [Photobacterium sp. SKA34]EAR54954.1 NADH dehydrogenase subunit N [Photobacterium sp. SKA34]